MSKKRKVTHIQDKDSDDVDAVSSVSTAASHVQSKETNCIDLRYYRRAEEDRAKLARLVKRKSADNSVLDAPDCSAVDCPYCL